MNIEFETHQADGDKFCPRCKSLGIEVPTIITGAEYIRVVVNGQPSYLMCMDCFERLREET